MCNIGKGGSYSTKQRKVIYRFFSVLICMLCFDSLIFKLGDVFLRYLRSLNLLY